MVSYTEKLSSGQELEFNDVQPEHLTPNIGEQILIEAREAVNANEALRGISTDGRTVVNLRREGIARTEDTRSATNNFSIGPIFPKTSAHQ